MLSLFYFTLPKALCFLTPFLSSSLSFNRYPSMSTSTIVSPSSISVRTSLKGNDSWSGNSCLYGKATLTHQKKSNQQRTLRKLATCAQYTDRSGGGGGDFVAGFLLGGALCGTMAYIFAPQIRRSLLNEDEYGFRRAKRPIYYDEGLEKTRQTLNAKISQLNTAIDNVSSRLRGRDNTPRVPVETDPEEATM